MTLSDPGPPAPPPLAPPPGTSPPLAPAPGTPPPAAAAPRSPVTLGFPPVDHAAPELDDRPRRTNRRSILAHVFTTLVAGVFGLVRFQIERTQSGGGWEDVPIGWVFAVAVPIIVGRFALEVLRWRAFTYRVNDHRLVIDKGVLTRHHVVVPFDRVQQVDVDRRFIALLLGLAAVRIDTAGMGSHTSVQLRYLDPKAANGLRAFILSHRDDRRAEASRRAVDDAGGAGGPVPAVVTAPPEETLLTLGPKRLVVAAVTHHSFVLLVPVIVGAAMWIAAVSALASSRPLRPALFLGLTGAVIGGLVAFALVQALLATIVRQWGFTLSHTGDDLHLRFGLTDQRHLTVPRRRIQHIEVVDNPVRRALGLVGVRLHTAASLSGDGPGHAGTKFEIPVMARAELDRLLPLLLADPRFHIPPITPRPLRARRRAVVRRVSVLALVAVVPALAARPFGFALLALAALGVPWGRAAHRRAGHAQTEAVAVVAHGVLHHRIVLVPRSRLQSTRTTSSPFQRRAHLRTIHLDVARATEAPRLFDMDEAAAEAWHVAAAAPAPPTGRRDQGDGCVITATMASRSAAAGSPQPGS